MHLNQFIKNDDQVIQRYISKPLLIDKKKHDLRLYVLIASVDPLVAFINSEGLARFCVDDYSLPTDGNKGNDAIHLTNYSLNKHSSKYNYSEILEGIHQGTKRTLQSYWESVKNEDHDINYVR